MSYRSVRGTAYISNYANLREHNDVVREHGHEYKSIIRSRGNLGGLIKCLFKNHDFEIIARDEFVGEFGGDLVARSVKRAR